MLAMSMGFGKGRLMSALGQKRTFAVQNGMSALPLKATTKADMCGATRNVRFVPIAVIPPFIRSMPGSMWFYSEPQTMSYRFGGATMGRGEQIGRNTDGFYLEAKARQASKLAEIREALVAAGYNSAAKQADVLGVARPTAWAFLNRDKRAGPSSVVIKRILSSPTLPPTARLKVEEYIFEKIVGLYAHTDERRRWFCHQIENFRRATHQTINPPPRRSSSKSINVPIANIHEIA
jgi:hypothetical protein